MHILLFGGFLGSGKTTTMMQVAEYLTGFCGKKVAIIENEAGTAGVDDKLFAESGIKVKRLFGGCVCCQITGELLSAIAKIHETLNPEWLLIEIAGLAFPSRTAGQIKPHFPHYSSFKTITLIDNSRWMELKAMLAAVVIGQVADSDFVIVNKTDIAGGDRQAIMDDIRGIAGGIKIVEISAARGVPAAILREIVSYES